MLKQALLFCLLLTISLCEEGKREDRRRKHVDHTDHVDPLAALDRHLSHTLAYHYLWPWNQIFKAAASLDVDNFEETQQTSDDKTYTIKLYAKSFKPEELKVKVKERNIIVEGKHNVTNDHQHFMTNHFVQRFVLPPGSKPEEVTAVFTDKNVLVLSIPRHEVPPPVERIVPIEVKLSESTSELPTTTENKEEKKVIKEANKDEKKEEKQEKKAEKVTKKPSSAKPTLEQAEKETIDEMKEIDDEGAQPSTVIPLEKLELQEATTHIGKIRKKELKETTKMTKTNQVTKGLDGNGLDYLLVDTE
ncbi:uncharacterized protein LOC113240228 [Hyposmocoma kahamanoa]|uniref:uncharacterized protein LOC113240228 n=1 Tax=Hyposmocoma kahamanoa TaxID=1477025 RepID=UPI000E6D8E19|nr:uncharacterized protein LOC113240228 [Hyposmocoma kahamanoa]